MHTDKMSRTVRILVRTEPCKCGCKGNDQSHKGAFKRILRNVRPEKGTALTGIGTVGYTQRAEAKFPWGTDDVVFAVVCLFGVPNVSVGWVRASECYPYPYDTAGER